MRIAIAAATTTLALLAACGGPQTSQANNASANVSGSAHPPATATASVAGAPVSGADAKAVLNERHEAMEHMGKASKAINRQLTGSSPDLAAIRSSANAFYYVSNKGQALFAKGSGPEAGKTGAKPDIWANPQDFAAKLQDFQKAQQAFGTAVNGTDVGAIKASFGNLQKTCKACHDKYRTEMHH
jgi:cytochrome c556